MWSVAFAFLSLPPWGIVAPQGRMRERVCDYIPLYGSQDKPAPHPSAVGAADNFPRREAFSPLLCARLAALDHEAVLVVSAVGVNESGLIVGVEEILLAQSLDLVVDGIQQRLIALADGGAIVS